MNRTVAEDLSASFQVSIESIPCPAWVLDLERLRFLDVNQAALSLYGYSRPQFDKMAVLDIIQQNHHDPFIHSLPTDADTFQKTLNLTTVRADGSMIDVCVYQSVLRNDGRLACLTIVNDVTDLKRTEASLRERQIFLETILENVPTPIMVKGVSTGQLPSEFPYLLINRAFEEHLGRPRADIMGRTAKELYPIEQVETVVGLANEALQCGQPVRAPDHAVYTKGKGKRIAASRVVAVRNDDCEAEYLIIVIDDVTERKLAEERVQHLAHHDVLTEMPNRGLFQDALARSLERSTVTGEPFAVLSIDLDRFKEANDTHGHIAGDAVLCEMARRMQEIVPKDALVARIGGDEFGVVLRDASYSAALADKIVEAASHEFTFANQCIAIGATIGGAIYPDHGTDGKTLLNNADIALYRAKSEAPGSVLFYQYGMGQAIRKRRAIREALRMALKRQEFILHYQPQRAISGEATGFEALIRWKNQDYGTLKPADFIPIAEESGLIGSIGCWALRDACREAATWPNSLSIAVNVSPCQFRNDDLITQVQSVLSETGLHPSRLELEVTESTLIENLSRTISVLSRLKGMGVRIVLDDFGSGFSSLSYVHAFRFDKLKIDRRYIADMDSNASSGAVVRAIIDLAHSLDVTTLGEGVETEWQHAALFRKGCDEVQGYLTGRPSPIEDYHDLTGRRRPLCRHKVA